MFEHTDARYLHKERHRFGNRDLCEVPGVIVRSDRVCILEETNHQVGTAVKDSAEMASKVHTKYLVYTSSVSIPTTKKKLDLKRHCILSSALTVKGGLMATKHYFSSSSWSSSSVLVRGKDNHLVSTAKQNHSAQPPSWRGRAMKYSFSEVRVDQ